jgi:hypothetical protein
MVRELFDTRLAIVAAVVAGDGNNISGQICKTYTNCHTPIKAAKNSATLAASVTSRLRL